MFFCAWVACGRVDSVDVLGGPSLACLPPCFMRPFTAHGGPAWTLRHGDSGLQTDGTE